MGFDVMDVFVKIGADTSGLEQGLNSAKGMASGLGSAVGTGMKVVGGAIAGATAAVGAFAASSVQVGSTFDSSMSQVAATMGVTVDEIGELRQFAQDMGATTAFSATQAADALNYMALAGYDAETSMNMLPNVLNLAAAGDMELATASDMVTDAQTALGLSIEETTEMVDMMAKTSSKSNTSVQQMGDAILTVGGTAKSLAGGTNELSTALGLLADNGIKGSEGGTKLRNVILSLSAPTDKAAEALESLGVQTADAEGNLRPLEDIMGELGDSMDGLGSTERADIISTIFNKTDIAAVNALLDTSSERWDELSAAIDDSAGAAEDMANTQLDNLNGDITLFKSALEGAQILVSDALTPSLREFVQFGTDGLTKISEGFKEGGLSGAMDAFGEVLSDGIGMITEMLPQVVDAGIQLLGALGQGIVDNAPQLFEAIMEIGSQLASVGLDLMDKLADGLAEFDWAGAAQNVIDFISNALESDSLSKFVTTAYEIVTNLVNGLFEAAPVLVSGAADLIKRFADGIRTNLPKMVASAGELVKKFGNYLVQNAPKMMDAGIELLMGIVDGLIASLPSLLETAATLIAQLVVVIIQNAPKMLAAGVELIVKLVVGLVQAIPQVLLAILNMVAQMLKAVVSVDWIGLGKQVINTILNGIVSLATSIPAELMKIATTAIEWAKKVDWIGLGISVINFIVDGITSLASAIPDKLVEIANNALDFVKGIDWVQLGKDIITGIVNGLLAMKDWLYEQFISIFSGMKKKSKESIESNSPSKWFRREVGKNIGLGIGLGIQDEKAMVMDSMEEITDSLKATDATIQVGNGINVNSALTGNGNNIDGQQDELEALADAIVRAFVRADIAVECDNREFGRLVKRLGVV